jgi:hypothetical protein
MQNVIIKPMNLMKKTLNKLRVNASSQAVRNPFCNTIPCQFDRGDCIIITVKKMIMMIQKPVI